MKIRPSTEGDLDAMVGIMFAEPGVEQVAFMPTISGGRRFTRAVWRLACVDEFIVAEDHGEVVGFAWCSERGISLREGARAAVAGWGISGPIRLVAKGWRRQLVEIVMPAGLKLIELQTHPARRGTGVGSALLEHVIEIAGGRPISLTTRSNNPARRLYERYGFSVVKEKDHGLFEAKTGARGRILMTRGADPGS